MNFSVEYESIKDSIVYSFEEYVEEDGFTAPQAAAKTFEEEWRRLNYNMFTKTTYYICTAIECFKLKEIPDFIYDKLDMYINCTDFEDDIKKQDIEQLLQDIRECKELMELKNYKIIESSYGAKSRIEYILSLKP
ncbi:hypothetical protein [Clostridium septicum]|uniref:Uncharacterized protein n=1 Tax=Clostridium septicum TaxID=1504 RepID=A0A9N7PIS8_CLOSE|nr:hypothetical protein [Clostridium septicum]AYE33990.1 hypothetical protein CP523_05670 [Clostridium septicum]MDU1315314.1 hypothetical protein [Clostridium septicum]QAS59354.1 hypothetical protein EI377_00105 [Clostridium septicum]QAS62131.1 hypothetical protein EI377_16180 [Clostridium septicum]UEC21390.1 hypothetical protein LK444_03160 [Clostridium septicum]